MTNSTAPATRLTLGVTVVVLLPLLWWCLSLAAAALGLWWETIGNVVVTWNIDTAVGLILLIPAAMFAGNSVAHLQSPTTFRRGRRYATAGLSLTALFCLLELSNPILNTIDPPAPRDPTSWSPELTAGEEWVVAAPYAVFLIPVILTVLSLWRHRPDDSLPPVYHP
ncbi:hypothetical protein [Rhodococcus sp. EPR-157]|uniref:hypothetical protein n=1 Tax=Rhodococcus sp. EPR-157 TaxID=1813677 RepID=UPI000AB7BC8E|nr:hypothetical protein [Rhodococcus sp. EPR-157]